MSGIPYKSQACPIPSLTTGLEKSCISSTAPCVCLASGVSQACEQKGLLPFLLAKIPHWSLHSPWNCLVYRASSTLYSYIHSLQKHPNSLRAPPHWQPSTRISWQPFTVSTTEFPRYLFHALLTLHCISHYLTEASFIFKKKSGKTMKHSTMLTKEYAWMGKFSINVWNCYRLYKHYSKKANQWLLSLQVC